MRVAAPQAEAEAQDIAPPAATRGLFGSDSRDPGRREQADFSMFFNVTNDSDHQLSSGTERELVDRWMLRQGVYSAAEGQLSYRRKNGRLVLAADATSSLQYHSQL